MIDQIKPICRRTDEKERDLTMSSVVFDSQYDGH